jgi:hypothetical protein
MTRTLVLMLCAALAAPGCATMRAANTRPAEAPQPPAMPDRALMAEYVRKLAIGSRVRVDVKDGRTLRGTLMKADADAIVVQPRTRLPEPPIVIPIEDLRAVELEQQGSTGRTVAIAVVAGAGATLGVLLLLAAIFSD